MLEMSGRLAQPLVERELLLELIGWLMMFDWELLLEPLERETLEKLEREPPLLERELLNENCLANTT